MARKSLEELTATLDSAIAAGKIWNVDFEDLKYPVGHVVEDLLKTSAIEALERQLADEEAAMFEQWVKATYPEYADPDTRRGGVWRSLSEAYSKTKQGKGSLSGQIYSVQQANTKVLLGYCRKAATLFPADARFDVVRAALAQVTPLMEKLDAVKPLIVKGRKPSETPNLNARTIEHTGTCGCCNRNIKLTEGGRIWDHGYSIEGRGHGYSSGYKVGGSCFGVGYEPIEVSPKVWQDMQAGMEQALVTLPERIARLEAKQCLRDYPESIAQLKVDIAAWTPRPLPGTAR